MKKNIQEKHGVTTVKCEEVQPLLVSYMSHELGPSRSDFVREHLRKCSNCQKVVNDMQSTMDILSNAAKLPSHIPDRLTPDRRLKINWYFKHPFMLWMERNILLISMIIVSILLILMAILLMQKKFGIDTIKLEDGDVYDVNVVRTESDMQRLRDEHMQRWNSNKAEQAQSPEATAPVNETKKEEVK